MRCIHLTHADYFLACLQHEPYVGPVLLRDKIRLFEARAGVILAVAMLAASAIRLGLEAVTIVCSVIMYSDDESTSKAWRSDGA